MTLPKILESGPTKLEAKILNYFQLPKKSAQTASRTKSGGHKTFDSITTELYCDAFGMELMPHTCSYARGEILPISHKGHSVDAGSSARNDNASLPSSLPTPIVAREGSTSDLVYQQIVAAGYQLGFLLPSKHDELKKQKCKTLEGMTWCDSHYECMPPHACRNRRMENERVVEQIIHLNTTAISKVVGTKSKSAIRNYKELSRYHTMVHNSTWIHSLPIVCPSEDLLAVLLRKSLELEERILPDFYATPMGKAEHERVFWDVWLEEKKLFCWVDIFRLFQNATTWEEIIDDRMVNHRWPRVNKKINTIE